MIFIGIFTDFFVHCESAIKTRCQALFKNRHPWIRGYRFRKSLHFNLEHEIYDIGTEILYETCFGHNSTQNAPKSIILEDSKSAGHFP